MKKGKEGKGRESNDPNSLRHWVRQTLRGVPWLENFLTSK